MNNRILTLKAIEKGGKWKWKKSLEKEILCFLFFVALILSFLDTKTTRLELWGNYTAIPYRVGQGACREPPLLKTGSQQCEQDPCNESRLSL